MKNLLKITTVLTLALSALVCVPVAHASSSGNSLGTVTFAKRSANLSPSAKVILNGIKHKIGSSGAVTVTGYVQNHSGEPATLGLSRANAVKVYLSANGVKQVINAVNGGVVNLGGSTAAGRIVDISQTSAEFTVKFNLNTAGLGTVVGKTPATVRTKNGVIDLAKYKAPSAKGWQWVYWGETKTGISLYSPEGMAKLTFKNVRGKLVAEYRPGKNVTLYGVWGIAADSRVGFSGTIKCDTCRNTSGSQYKWEVQTAQGYGAWTWETLAQVSGDTPWSGGLGLVPLRSRTDLANLRFAFPDHGSGKVGDYVIKMNGTPINFTNKTFEHDVAKKLNYYYLKSTAVTGFTIDIVDVYNLS